MRRSDWGSDMVEFRPGELSGQMSLDLFPTRGPTWGDVQKGRARAVPCAAYSNPCEPSCMWSGSISGGRCYLFAKPVYGGMCPATVRLEPT